MTIIIMSYLLLYSSSPLLLLLHCFFCSGLIVPSLLFGPCCVVPMVCFFCSLHCCSCFFAVFFLLHTKVVAVFVVSAFLVDPLLKCVKIELHVLTSCLMQLFRCHRLHSAIPDILAEKHLCRVEIKHWFSQMIVCFLWVYFAVMVESIQLNH